MDSSKAILIAVARADLIICQVYSIARIVIPIGCALFATIAVASRMIRARKE